MCVVINVNQQQVWTNSYFETSKKFAVILSGSVSFEVGKTSVTFHISVSSIGLVKTRPYSAVSPGTLDYVLRNQGKLKWALYFPETFSKISTQEYLITSVPLEKSCTHFRLFLSPYLITSIKERLMASRDDIFLEELIKLGYESVLH